MFTPDRILRFCPHATSVVAEEVAAALELHGLTILTTPLRSAHFMGQIAHESGGLTHFVENLNYSAPRIGEVWPRLAARAEELAHRPEALANAAYADHLGNGSEKSGDGWRFRGRGIIQITGRSNYSIYRAAGFDILSDPNKAAEPEAAAAIALTLWHSRGCNAKADHDDVEGVTRLINGPGMLGLVDRRILTDRAKTIFTLEEPLIA